MEVNVRRWHRATSLLVPLFTICIIGLAWQSTFGFSLISTFAPDALYVVDPQCRNETAQQLFVSQEWFRQFSPPSLFGDCRFSEAQQRAVICVMLPAFALTALLGISFLSGIRANDDVEAPSKKRILQISACPFVVSMLLNGIRAVIASRSSIWDWCTPQANYLLNDLPWINQDHASWWIGTPEVLGPVLEALIKCFMVGGNTLYFSESMVAIEVGFSPTPYLLSSVERVSKWASDTWITTSIVSAAFFCIQLAVAHKCTPAQPYQALELNPNEPAPPPSHADPPNPPSHAAPGSNQDAPGSINQDAPESSHRPVAVPVPIQDPIITPPDSPPMH